MREEEGRRDEVAAIGEEKGEIFIIFVVVERGIRVRELVVGF